MAKDKILFETEEKRDLASVADFLRELADRIDKKQVTFTQGDEELTIDLPNHITMEIKIEEEQKRELKHKLEIELEWKESDFSLAACIFMGCTWTRIASVWSISTRR